MQTQYKLDLQLLVKSEWLKIDILLIEQCDTSNVDILIEHLQVHQYPNSTVKMQFSKRIFGAQLSIIGRKILEHCSKA